MNHFQRAISRPNSARRADGMWPDGYRPDQQLARDRKLPAMYIGSQKMVWAPRSRLQPLDLEIAIKQRETTPDAQLAQAYGHVIDLLGRDSLRYYKDMLYAQQLSDMDEAFYEYSAGVGRTTGVLKETDLKADSSCMDDECSDDNRSDEEDLAALVAKPPSIKQVNINTANRILEPDNRGPQWDQETAEEAELSMVNVYVGNPWQIFRVRHTKLGLSPVLYNIVTFTPGDGYSAMLPLLSRIDPADFRPIAEYIEVGEYIPFIMDPDTDYAYLDGLSGHDESRAQVIQSGVIFNFARLLEMPGLQSLALSKFKALKPYPAYEFLVVAGTSFGSGLAGDDRLDKFLVQYFAKHYLSLVKAERKLVDQVLEKHPVLEERIRIMPGSGLIERPRTEAGAASDLDDEDFTDDKGMFITTKSNDAPLDQIGMGVAGSIDLDGTDRAGYADLDDQANEGRFEG
ncbi:MAG: hypothetical protein Q9177_003741 [Variospora cf. flavescens]